MNPYSFRDIGTTCRCLIQLVQALPLSVPFPLPCSSRTSGLQWSFYWTHQSCQRRMPLNSPQHLQTQNTTTTTTRFVWLCSQDIFQTHDYYYPVSVRVAGVEWSVCLSVSLSVCLSVYPWSFSNEGLVEGLRSSEGKRQNSENTSVHITCRPEVHSRGWEKLCESRQLALF